tara:strand:- start:3 stop:248 length:246 start_codon:yes stop_codon:yes gene_type:complete
VNIKFKYYSIVLDSLEVKILKDIVNEDFTLKMFAIDDWHIIDLLWRKHLVIYDKLRERKPEIQPWCRSNVLRALSSEQSIN